MTRHDTILEPPTLGAPHGRRVSGYRCPRCGDPEHIYHRIRPYRGMHMLGAILLGWLGWLDAESDRRAWLTCDVCGCSFRRRTTLVAWWILWCVLLVAGTVTAFAIARILQVDERAQDATGLIVRAAAIAKESPVAAGFAMLWIIVFTGISLVMLSWRVRRYHRRIASTMPKRTEDRAPSA